MGYALQVARSYRKYATSQVELETGQAKYPDAEKEPDTPKEAGYIYSRLLGMKIFPIREPGTGKITKVITESGAVFTEEDINAFRMIRDTFGIDEMLGVVNAKKSPAIKRDGETA